MHLFMVVPVTPSATVSDSGGLRYCCLLRAAPLYFLPRGSQFCIKNRPPSSQQFIPDVTETRRLKCFPVLLIPVRNNKKPKIIAGINNTAKELFTGVNDTTDKFLPVSVLTIPTCLNLKISRNSIYKCKVHSSKLLSKYEKNVYLKIFLFYHQCR
jgi:hypothetical protein